MHGASLSSPPVDLEACAGAAGGGGTAEFVRKQNQYAQPLAASWVVSEAWSCSRWHRPAGTLPQSAEPHSEQQQHLSPAQPHFLSAVVVSGPHWEQGEWRERERERERES